MIERRTILKTGGVAAAVLALTAVESGATAGASEGVGNPSPWVPMPDAAQGGVSSPPFAKNLTARELDHLRTFDELDFEIFSHADWARFSESHAPYIRVHWPDGHFTDGLEPHIADLVALFVWAPDTRIEVHPLRVAKNELTAVTGVMKGTFTRPMPDGKGGFIPPTGKAYAINMATVGIWNSAGTMDEEFLFWDNLTFFQQIGLA